MVYTPKIGDVVKVRNWHGVILQVHYDTEGNPSILQVQTARNIFRSYGPEFIDLRLAPDQIQPASRQDLEHEMETHRRLLDSAADQMMRSIKSHEILPQSY